MIFNVVCNEFSSYNKPTYVHNNVIQDKHPIYEQSKNHLNIWKNLNSIFFEFQLVHTKLLNKVPNFGVTLNDM